MRLAVGNLRPRGVAWGTVGPSFGLGSAGTSMVELLACQLPPSILPSHQVCTWLHPGLGLALPHRETEAQGGVPSEAFSPMACMLTPSLRPSLPPPPTAPSRPGAQGPPVTHSEH